MATTSDYLNQLKQDKSNLVSNLNTKGVTASNEETFTSLVPKVLDIQSGGEDFEITDASYLFIMGGRLDIEDLLLSKLYKPISLYGMYAGAKKETIDLSNIDLSECTSLSQMFYNCDIETIIHTNFDCSSVIGCSNIFTSNNKLVNLCALKNLGKGYTQKTNNYSNYRLILQDCSNLTHDSLMNIINGLYDLNLTYDVANGGTLYTQSLILGETNLAKLTETEIAVATNKGWAVS